jgi:hypothetical protein
VARRCGRILDGVSSTRLVRRWEDLHVVAQVAVVLPLAVVLLTILHLTALNQPFGRGVAYGVFWGALLTAVLVGASRSERARRVARERGSEKGRTPPA